MGELVNLRRVRKARRRAADEDRAAENRARFGRSRTEREATVEEIQRRDAVLDGLRLDRPGTEGGD